MIQISASRITIITVGLAALIVGGLAACANNDATAMPARASGRHRDIAERWRRQPTPSRPHRRSPRRRHALAEHRARGFRRHRHLPPDHGTHAAVAAEDLTSGATLFYNSSVGFHTASIVKVDILATLLLQHQHAHTSITGSENALAVRMITQSDNDAANSLWHVVGGSAGVRAANNTFHLTGTRPGHGGDWGSTITTAADQLTLLKVLATPTSPLSASSRAYELGLMSRVESDQRWGVPSRGRTRRLEGLQQERLVPVQRRRRHMDDQLAGRDRRERSHVPRRGALEQQRDPERRRGMVGSAATVALTGLTGD